MRNDQRENHGEHGETRGKKKTTENTERHGEGREKRTLNTQILIPEHRNTRIPEWLSILLILGLHFGLRCVGMRANVLNAKYDEGVYVSLMQGVAEGTGALYQDFILCHPPGVILAGAWLWPRVGGDIVILRLIYIGLCALSLLPLYALTRRLYGVKAALLTLFLLATTPGFANWVGQIVLLDPLLNVLVAAALWGLTLILRGDTEAGKPAFTFRLLPVAFLLGALLGLGYIIKETALPIGFAMTVALASVIEFPSFLVRRSSLVKNTARVLLPLVFGLGCLLTCGLMILLLSRIPNYLHYTFGYNVRDPFDWKWRPYELLNGFYALPFLMPLGVAGVWQMLRHSRSREERFLAVYAIAITLIMFWVPRRFYWRYFLPALPVYCIGVWVWWERWVEKGKVGERQKAKGESAIPEDLNTRTPEPHRSLVVGRWSLVVLFGLVHLASLILYRTHEGRNPPEYRTALQIIKDGPGPLFTLDYLWYPASGHPVTPGVQQLVRDTIHVPVTSEEYTQIALQCPTVILDWQTLYWLPQDVERVLRQRYHSVFRYGERGDKRYVEIFRRPEEAGTTEAKNNIP